MYSPMSCITGCTVDGDIEFIDDLDGVFTQCADCANVDDPPVVQGCICQISSGGVRVLGFHIGLRATVGH